MISCVMTFLLLNLLNVYNQGITIVDFSNQTTQDSKQVNLSYFDIKIRKCFRLSQ